MSNPDEKTTKIEQINASVRQERARLLDVEERILRLTARLTRLEEKAGHYS